MKKNLIKILAIASIALAAGACRGKKKSEDPYKEVVINELFELEADGKFKLEGQLVRLKNQCIYGNYGTTYVAGVDYDSAEDARDYKGFELELSAHPDWKGETKGRYANVDVTGKLVNVNGRPVLQEGAVETIHAEAQYDADGNRVDNDGAFSAGLWAKSGMKRSTWDTYFDRGNSGALLAGIFQIASVPSAAVAGDAASEFYVTFPGENLDVNDEDNDSLIPVTFPKGLNEAAVTAANAFLEGKKAGDFMDVYALSYYDSEKGGTCLMLENWWTKYAKAPDAKDVPEILHSWAEVNNKIKGYYDGAVMDLSGATIDDDGDAATPEVPDPTDKMNAPFSYLIDDSNVGKNPRDLWVEAYKDKLVKVSDPAACGTVEVTANIKAADMEAYYDALKAKVTAATYMDSHPFVCDESAANTDGYVIFTQTIGTTVVRELLLMAGSSQSYELYYTAPKAELAFANFADFKARLESTASAKVSSLSGAAYTHTSALPAFPEGQAPSKLTFRWMYQDKYDAEYATYGSLVRYDFEFEYADEAKAVAALAAYKTALGTASFAEKKFTLFGLTGLYNATSKEFVYIAQKYDSTAKAYTKYLTGYIFILDATSSAFLTDLPATDAALQTLVGDFYTSLSYTLGTCLPNDLGATGNATVRRNYDFDSSNDAYGILIAELEINYTNEITNEQFQEIAAKFGTLVLAAFPALGVSQGYWNASTNEFLLFSVQGNTLVVDLIKIWAGMEGGYIQIL